METDEVWEKLKKWGDHPNRDEGQRSSRGKKNKFNQKSRVGACLPPQQLNHRAPFNTLTPDNYTPVNVLDQLITTNVATMYVCVCGRPAALRGNLVQVAFHHFILTFLTSLSGAVPPKLSSRRELQLCALTLPLCVCGVQWVSKHGHVHTYNRSCERMFQLSSSLWSSAREENQLNI